MALIDPQLKDIILKELVETHEVGSLSVIKRTDNICGIGGDTLAEIINQFVRKGLFRYSIDRNGKTQSGTSDSIMFWINVDAHDFILRGGFYGQEDLFKSTVERLLLQVEKLEAKEPEGEIKIKNIRENIEKYLSIIANLGTAGDTIGKLIS